MDDYISSQLLELREVSRRTLWPAAIAYKRLRLGYSVFQTFAKPTCRPSGIRSSATHSGSRCWPRCKRDRRRSRYLEYQFRVIYSLQSATKGTAHFQFIQPGSEEAAEIQNVLLKYKVPDELYPHKPQAVVDAVKRQSGRAFSSDRHVRAWKKYKVRPRTSDPKPENTNCD